jgi:hypothetical protein
LCLRIFLRRFLITLPTEAALLVSWRWIERRDQYCLTALPSSAMQQPPDRLDRVMEGSGRLALAPPDPAAAQEAIHRMSAWKEAQDRRLSHS